MAPKWRAVPTALSCKTEKIRYPSERIAEAELLRLQEFYVERESERVPTRTYECRHCGGWHVTSKEYNP